MAEVFDPLEKERQFQRKIISQYLKYGSVDAVFRRNDYNLPISYSGFHRLLTKWGIIKAAGPNCKLAEAVCFLTLLSQNQVPLEHMYRQMPMSFKTSLSTMHRIMGHVKEGVVRRAGTALVITRASNPAAVLIGRDVSVPRVAVDAKLGKFIGALSLPMGFSKANEDPRTSILRVLQHEVFTQKAICQKMPDVIPTNPKPFMHLAIADISVQVFDLVLPDKLGLDFSSFKLEEHRFLSLREIYEQEGLRSGVKEVVKGYEQYVEKAGNPTLTLAQINQTLAFSGVS